MAFIVLSPWCPCSSRRVIRLQHWNVSLRADLLTVWTPLRSLATGQCVDYSKGNDPLETTADCVPHSASQAYTLDKEGHISAAGPGSHCLDVYSFSGPDVENGGCKTPAVGDSNQVWTQLPGNLLQTASNHYHGKPPMCLTLTAGSVGGTLSTTDDEGQKWLMKAPQWQESNAVRAGSAQSAKGTTWQVNADPHSPGNVTIAGQMRSSYMPSQLGFLEEFGASGPLPHTRYLQPGHSSWTFDSNAKGANACKIKLFRCLLEGGPRGEALPDVTYKFVILSK